MGISGSDPMEIRRYHIFAFWPGLGSSALGGAGGCVPLRLGWDTWGGSFWVRNRILEKNWCHMVLSCMTIYERIYAVHTEQYQDLLKMFQVFFQTFWCQRRIFGRPVMTW